MTRYPSPAELAAFRRSMARTAGTGMPGVPLTGRAFAHELQHGIGYRASFAPPMHLPVPDPYITARREASALRSRAYIRACAAASPEPCADCGAIGWHTRACPADWPAL